MQKILDYLMKTYAPSAIIVYGSYADGSNNQASDFDALVIAEGVEKGHDETVLGGVCLDVFVYPSAAFRAAYDPEAFLGVHGGKIVLDRDGLAAGLKARVAEHIAAQPLKTPRELRTEVAWCEKMCRRAERGDAEGYFRWHWVLIDSLEIYMDLRRERYYGPKKALRYMRQADEEAFFMYGRALSGQSYPALTAWIALLKTRLEQNAVEERHS